jgi:hypothetical protein
MKFTVTIEEVLPVNPTTVRMNLSDAIAKVETRHIRDSLSLNRFENRLRSIFELQKLTGLTFEDSRFLVELLIKPMPHRKKS